MVDTRALKVEKVIPGLGIQATGITLDERAGKVYVSNLRGQLYTIDTRTLALERQAQVAANSLLNLVQDKKRGHLLGI